MSLEPIEDSGLYVHTFGDLKAYSDNVMHAQEDLLQTARGARGRAALTARLGGPADFVQNHGDGELVRWPAAVRGLDILDRYLSALAVEFRRVNERRADHAKARLRVAVVEGYSRRVGDNLVGQAPVTARRFLDCWQARLALDLFPDHPVVAVIDSGLYDLARQRLGSLEPDRFLPIRIGLPEKGFADQAWLTVPGCDASELERLRKEITARDVEAGPAPPPETPRRAATARTPGAGTGTAGDTDAVARGGAARDTGAAGEADAVGDAGAAGDAGRGGRRPRWWTDQAAATIVAAVIAAVAAVAAAVVPALPWNDDKPGTTAPRLSVDGTCTAPGDHLTVSSGGFTPDGPYTVTVTDPDGRPYPLSNGSRGRATGQGALNTDWTCEAKDAAGEYTMTVTDETSHRSARDTFQVDKVG
ncbi:hypothetical protein [Streptomyces sp. NPDC096012]|uniref:hypothetical protein n=1 Tax=Streptomyces sp. NPDC096012 TaxID=3155684 RepID=UPI00336ABE81